MGTVAKRAYEFISDHDPFGDCFSEHDLDALKHGDHSNLFHDALTRVRDIAKNGSHNQQAWIDVLEIVDAAIESARKQDERRWLKGA